MPVGKHSRGGRRFSDRQVVLAGLLVAVASLAVSTGQLAVGIVSLGIPGARVTVTASPSPPPDTAPANIRIVDATPSNIRMDVTEIWDLNSAARTVHGGLWACSSKPVHCSPVTPSSARRFLAIA